MVPDDPLAKMSPVTASSAGVIGVDVPTLNIPVPPMLKLPTTVDDACERYPFESVTALAMPPVSVVAPVTASVLDNVAAPVNVEAPVTVSVPSAEILVPMVVANTEAPTPKPTPRHPARKISDRVCADTI